MEKGSGCKRFGAIPIFGETGYLFQLFQCRGNYFKFVDNEIAYSRIKFSFIMKIKYILFLLFASYTASAQLTITPGAEFFVIGNMQLTLQNTNLVNNGIFSPGINTTSFTGDASSSISGAGTVRFFQLEVNKTGNKSVLLQKKIDVVQRVLFVDGFLDLNGFDLDLETTGRVDFEREDSRITGANGGQVLFTTNLNSPVTANPGGLGLFITTNQNLGNVIIRRGHQSQVNGAGLGATIFRYFDIVPDNNANLNATLGVNYFNGELNGFNENQLEFWRSNDNIHWTDIGFTTREASNNFVDKTGIASFGRFTLSTANNPLPVHFILFNVHCENDRVLLTWKTAQEQNSDHFDIERSSDGTRWASIGSLPAAGNSAGEETYSFTDNNPLPNGNYRIAEHGLDGSVQYTNILRSDCTVKETLSAWPNPTRDMINISIVSNSSTQAMIRIFDAKGSLVNVQRKTILQGRNQVGIDLSKMASGIYQFQIDWNNGQTKKTMQVLKQ